MTSGFEHTKQWIMTIWKFKRKKNTHKRSILNGLERTKESRRTRYSNNIQQTAKHTIRGSLWSRALTTSHGPFTFLQDRIAFWDWRLMAETPLAACWPEPTTSKHNTSSLSTRGRASRYVRRGRPGQEFYTLNAHTVICHGITLKEFLMYAASIGWSSESPFWNLHRLYYLLVKVEE